MKALQSRVLRFVRRHGVLNPGERALLAVSGGQDSSALLLIASRLAAELGVEVAVAHFDHRLRSRGESHDDEQAVRKMAQALGLPFATGSGDTRARAARRHESIEEAARVLRFAFLAREAERLDAGVVVLGHTRDDRAETVLLHLLRGSGLDGLIGLRPRSGWPFASARRRAGAGPALARPLLAVTRAETGRYCREARVLSREDPTNLLLEATRNRLRHELLPALREFNPRLDDALCRLGDAAASAVAHLDVAAEGAWQTLASVERRAVGFPRNAFQELSPAVRARLLRRAMRHLAGPSADVEAVHVEALEAALGKRRAAVALPQALTARVGPRDVRVCGGEPAASQPIEETCLAVPGRTELPGWSVVAEIVTPPPAQARGRSRWEALLDADAAGGPLVVRSRRAGDRLRPLGLGGEKKLQDMLVDAKVPEEERDGVPLVCAPWGIVWVVGQRLDERAALREGSRRAVRLRFRRRGAGR